MANPGRDVIIVTEQDLPFEPMRREPRTVV